MRPIIRFAALSAALMGMVGCAPGTLDVNFGALAGKRGDDDGLIRHSTRAISAQARRGGDSGFVLAVAYNNRCAGYGAKEEFDKAIEDCTKAIEIEPYGDPYNNRGFVYYRMDLHDRAIEDYSQAIGMGLYHSGDTFMVYVNRGQAYAEKGLYDRSIEDFDQAIRLAPDEDGGYAAKAWLLATCPDVRFRDGKEAVRLVEKALELAEEDTYRHHADLAAAYAEVGRFDDAVGQQERAIAMLEAEGRGSKKFKGETLLKILQKRLRAYGQGEPWRDVEANREGSSILAIEGLAY